MPVSVILWVLFFIALIVIIFALMPAAKRTWIDFSENRNAPDTQAAEQPSGESGTSQPQQDFSVTENRPHETPVENTPPAEQATGSPIAEQPAQPPAVETRDRVVYFMQLDRDGNILHPVKVSRRLPVSTSPLQDSLNALFAGPTAEEKDRRLETFLPEGSKILSIEIRGNTAFINCNEEFQYNPFGTEGIDAQLQQVVWTATEFPNVRNVQFLIEGKRIVFLNEGINIENPIGRQ